MQNTVKKHRKHRSDRKYLVYVIENSVTLEYYVGVTACIDRSGKETLAARWSRHIGRAYNQNKNWNLCRSIREYGYNSFVPLIFCLIRGKKEAFELETELRKSGSFVLNTF